MEVKSFVDLSLVPNIFFCCYLTKYILVGSCLARLAADKNVLSSDTCVPNKIH